MEALLARLREIDALLPEMQTGRGLRATLPELRRLAAEALDLFRGLEQARAWQGAISERDAVLLRAFAEVGLARELELLVLVAIGLSIRWDDRQLDEFAHHYGMVVGMVLATAPEFMGIDGLRASQLQSASSV